MYTSHVQAVCLCHAVVEFTAKNEYLAVKKKNKKKKQEIEIGPPWDLYFHSDCQYYSSMIHLTCRGQYAWLYNYTIISAEILIESYKQISLKC